MSSKRAAKAPTKKKSSASARKKTTPRKTTTKRAVVKKAATKKTVKKAPAKKTARKVVAARARPENATQARKLAPPRSAKSVGALHAPHFDPGLDEGLDPGALPLDEVHDEAEIAQHLQLQEQAAISRKAREMNRPEFHPDFDGETCVECGEDIPPARLLLKRVRCVDCQSFLEEASARQRRLQG